MNKKFLSAILFGALAVSAGSFVSCKSYDDDIDNLRKEIANMSSIKADASALSSAIDAAKSALQSDIKSAAQQAVADAKAQALEEAKKEIAKIQTGASMEEVQTAISNAIAKIEACNCDVDGKIAAAVANLVKSADMEAALSTLEQKIKTDMAALYLQQDALNGYAKLTDVTAAVTTAQTAVMAAIETAKTAATAEAVAAAKAEAAAKVSEVDAMLNTLAPVRLTSLVFAPDTYIHGIEAIQFKTLNYEDWTVLYADAPQTDANAYVVDNKETEANYYVSPANINKEGIKDLSFLYNANATNTRAAAAAPIKVASWEIDQETGMLKLKLEKTTAEPLGHAVHVHGNENIKIVALKATLNDVVKTADEKKNNAEVAVFSDWARLDETSVRPYIHAKNVNEGHDTYSEAKNRKSSHFWNFSTVYNDMGSQVPAVTNILSDTNNDRFVAAEPYYAEPFDLRTLVNVCVKEGTTYASQTICTDGVDDEILADYEKYGLEFEFKVIDYTLKNEYSTTDATNQKYFAKLAEDGYTLTSTARDNTTANNRDAIGRQPMIQIVLRDTKNNKVVDVRYAKIKWSDKTEVVEYGQLDAFTADYLCGADASQTILEEKVNAVYTFVNMSKPEFHSVYSPNYYLYTTKAAAENASAGVPEDPANTLGSFTDMSDWWEAGQTHNFKWTINTTQNAATQAEYAAGKKEIEAWGFFYKNSNNKSKVLFKLNLTLNLPKMAYVYNKDMAMWTELSANDAKGGKRNINPALESDDVTGNSVFATTQIFGSLLEGYIKENALGVGVTPSTIGELVNFGDEVKFVFDEAGLSSLPGTGWNISDDGLTLYKGTEIAATLDATGKVQLKESNNGSATSVPTTAAKELISKSVKVKLVDKWCALVESIDSYDVFFMTPLDIVAPTEPVTLTDVTAGGSSAATIKGAWTIKEHYTTNKRIVWDNATPSHTNATLVDWYGVETLVYDIPNAKTNVQPNGTIGSTCNTLLTKVVKSDGVSPKYVVGVDAVNDKVTFENKSNNALGQSIKIEIPVTVKTKWQTLTTKLEIVVNPALSD